ncbi:hypothetical protein C2S52_018935 [Perilla frutescens var. hirtella]|nr:hypothetical protein C2S52_018935 [Perilla frutescens var. hirtella]
MRSSSPLYVNFFRALIPLGFLLALPTARSQTTSFTYDFHGNQPTTLTYQGDAHVESGSPYLRLIKTNASGAPQTYSIGRVVYSSPVPFRSAGTQADLETTIKFIITGSNPGDGLTFFIAPVGYEIPAGSTGGNFGVYNPSGSSTAVFAVEFDTVKNSWDPSYRHVGINIESSTSSNLTRVDDAVIGQEVTARINYEEATKLISVHVAAGGQNFEVSYVHDLGTVLPEQVQVGISAATGDLVSNHDVISWYFTSTLVQTGAAVRGGDGAGYVRQVHHGAKVDDDPILGEMLHMLTLGEHEQGWALISHGAGKIARAKGDVILKALVEFEKWSVEVKHKGFVVAMNDYIEGHRSVEHHCNRLILPGIEDIPGAVVCTECHRPMEKFIVYRCCTE